MDVQEAIRSRRAVRRYKSTPVDDKTLNLVLEAARLAPSWANTQCWRFIVVRNADTKAKLAATLSETNPARNAVKDAPVLIAACAKLGRAGYKRGEATTDKGDWYMFDVAIAMQNLALCAHALGLGTVYIGLFDAKKAAGILEIPPGFCAVAMTPLGFPDEQPNPTSRRGLSEIASYERFNFEG